MAGEGTRFKNKGYTIPKPLIDIKGKPMFIRAANCMPPADLWIFICQKNLLKDGLIYKYIKENFNNYEIIYIDYLTDGQASTCNLAKKYLIDNDQIFISACDSYFEYNADEYFSKINTYDVLVFSTKSQEIHFNNVNLFGWIKSNNIFVEKISCKSQLSDEPKEDKVIIGTFAFKNLYFYKNSLNNLFKHKNKINNEYYMDMVIAESLNLGFEVGEIVVNNYISWGTPEELILSSKNTNKIFENEN